MNKMLRGNKAGRHWEDLVGYTLQDLIEHIEKQFKKGMSWNNYNKTDWNIDHIIPLCKFNLEDPDEIKVAFAPGNHQWLLAKDNLSKGGKYDFLT